MRYFFAIFVLLLLDGCNTPSVLKVLEPKVINSQSATILMKSNKLKYNDNGFINTKDDNSMEIRAFTTGVEILKMDINSHICLNSVCYTKDVFNRDYLCKFYPQDTLQQIFNGKEIFHSDGIKYYNGYYTQEILNVNYDIFYKVTKNEIYFKDIQNNILIKIIKI